MSEARRLMSADEFLEWCTVQEGRYELVGGEPVAMAGAKRRHDRIVRRSLAVLEAGLAGHACQPFTADFAVRIPMGNIRRPDLGIDCGPMDDDDLAARDPRVVIEVLSPSTRAFDLVVKLGEYKRVPGLCHILLIDPDEPRVVHWLRGSGGTWLDRHLEGLDAVIELGDPAVSISLRDIYDGLTFAPRPRPVSPPSA